MSVPAEHIQDEWSRVTSGNGAGVPAGVASTIPDRSAAPNSSRHWTPHGLAPVPSPLQIDDGGPPTRVPSDRSGHRDQPIPIAPPSRDRV